MKRKPFWFLRRKSRDIAADVDDELHEHLDRRTDELIAAGLSPDDARRQAIGRFGDVEATRRYCRQQHELKERDMQRQFAIADLGQDMRIALRALLRAPVLALTIVAS